MIQEGQEEEQNMEKMQESKRYALSVKVMVLLALFMGGTRTTKGQEEKLTAIPFTDVTIADDFWAPRLETNRKVTIPYAFKKCEETGRISNFAKAGGLIEGNFEGIYFNDSDVYKVIEGAAYSLKNHPDPELEEYVDKLIDKIAAAQWQDGYLYTFYSVPKPQPEKRWTDIQRKHELYCAGHFFEAAVAYYQATGKRKILDVAIRLADYIDSVFGPVKKRDVPGHEEIEIGLVKLYQVTGDKKYLKLAKFFLDERGHARGRNLYGTYCQDHQPVTEQTEPVGHAVRAGYLYTGMADVAALTDERQYQAALERIWHNVVGRKMYITGGIGSRGSGEAFGEDYELPNARAYCETCAAIANAMWNHRMFLLSGDAKYIDVLERVIYNGFLSGVALEGDKFFYPNPLETHEGRSRSPWFGCACCPTNIVRFIPSLPGYAYAHKGDILYVNLFIGGSANIKADGNTVRLKQETRYPWDGDVKMTVEPARSGEFAINVRIPGWAQNRCVPSDLYRYLSRSKEEVTLKVNNKPLALDIDKGFARIHRKWKKGDTIEMHLPMPARRVLSHERVAADRGRVALQRGPVVFCAEFTDNKNAEVLNLYIPDDVKLHSEFKPDLLGGVVTIGGTAVATKRQVDGTIAASEKRTFVAIPYYGWSHRGTGQMAVWIAREPAFTKPAPAPTLAHSSKITVSGGGVVSALTDQLEPASSIDHSNPFFHWWPRKGTTEWVQLDFKKQMKISEATVYWFDDTGIGQCRLPKSWRLLYRDGEQWEPVTNHGPYAVEKDEYNKVTFDAVTTDAVRFKVQLAEKFSAGIHELDVR